MANTLRHREAQPWRGVLLARRAGNQVDVVPVSPSSTLENAVKVALVLQPTSAPQRSVWRRNFARRRRISRRSRRRRDHFVETDMRRRPLARRRFNTARPFLVAMRARKPWVRSLEILLGLPRPFFTLRSSVHGLARRLPKRNSAVCSLWKINRTPVQHTPAKAAGAEVYTNLRKMRVPSRIAGWACAVAAETAAIAKPSSSAVRAATG